MAGVLHFNPGFARHGARRFPRGWRCLRVAPGPPGDEEALSAGAVARDDLAHDGAWQSPYGGVRPGRGER
eukprot:4499385-Pyramimonas_sp.AAC.1